MNSVHTQASMPRTRRLFGREAVGNRFPGQHLCDRLRTALVSFPRRAGLAGALVIVEIELVGRRDHEVVAFFAAASRTSGLSLRHHWMTTLLGALGFDLLVPCHRPLAEALDDPDDLAPEIGLDVLVVFSPCSALSRSTSAIPFHVSSPTSSPAKSRYGAGNSRATSVRTPRMKS